MENKGSNLRQIAYDGLRQMILDGTLKPGEPLVEKELMARLNVGRMPLRDAMQQLQAEDALEIFPRCGTFVRPLNAEDIVALYQARLVLEPEIARIATPTAEKTMLGMFRDIFAGDGSRDAMIQQDVNFHRFLCQSTRNRYFKRAMEVIFFQDQRIRMRSSWAVEDLSQSNRAHIGIIDCMLRGDAGGAGNAMREHILQSQDTALSLIIHQDTPI